MTGRDTPCRPQSSPLSWFLPGGGERGGRFHSHMLEYKKKVEQRQEAKQAVSCAYPPDLRSTQDSVLLAQIFLIKLAAPA